MMLVIAIGTNAQPTTRINFDFFYTSLAPYGEWIELDYNFYVWKPYHVKRYWRPYMHGSWVYSPYGWYWVSQEPYGWATYHYGRWFDDDYYGWVWIPGYDWAPAWVEWRYNDDYIGWAPLPPYAEFRISVGIYWTSSWHPPIHHWNFVRYRHMCNPKVYDHYLPAERTRRFFGSTRSNSSYEFENNRIINRGLDREFIENRTGDRIRNVEIVETRDRKTERIFREGDRQRLEIYQPSAKDVDQNRPERIDAKRADRRTTLNIEKIDRSIFQERNERDGGIRKPEKEGTEQQTDRLNNREIDRSVEKQYQEKEIQKNQEREKIRRDRNKEEERNEIRKQEGQSRKIEDRKSKYEDRKSEIKREEQKNKSREIQRETRPERREREIEIHREQVRPREKQDEPRREQNPRPDRGGERDSPRNRSGRE